MIIPKWLAGIAAAIAVSTTTASASMFLTQRDQLTELRVKVAQLEEGRDDIKQLERAMSVLNAQLPILQKSVDDLKDVMMRRP